MGAGAGEARASTSSMACSGLKTHGKMAMVVRSEADGLQRYLHLGTGNYNASTARIYDDFCLLTAVPNLAPMFPNSSTCSPGIQNRIRFASCWSRRSPCAALCRANRARDSHQQEHGNGRLIFKFNSLVDPEYSRCSTAPPRRE